MLKIDATQSRMFRDVVFANYKSSMRDHIRDFAPERIEAAGEDALTLFVDRRVDRAIALGLRQRGPVRLWLELSVVLGASFETDPQHAPLIPDLDPSDWPMPYAQRLHSAATAYIRECFGDDRAIVGRVIAETIHRDLPNAGAADDFLLDTVQDVWPERIAFAGPGPIRALATAAEAAAAKTKLASERGRLLMATLSLCFGAGVMDDPLYPFLHARLTVELPEEERIERTLKGLRFYAARVAERYPSRG